MPGTTSPPRRLDGSMSLLAELATSAQDPAYARAAAARTLRPPVAAPRRTAALALVLLLVGLGTGAAAAYARAASRDPSERAGLVREVQQRTAQSDALTRRRDALRADVDARRAAALAGQGPAAAAALSRLALAAATVAVTGPGLVVTLDDRPAVPDPAAPGARGGQIGSGRVLDRDLQQAVNGLWAAGAEAISIDDQRLTARTAIRSAGEAVLVDFRPLRAPYVLRAIGDPDLLEPGFVDGVAGRQLASYTSLYGLRLSVEVARTALALPAGSPPEPRDAVAVPTGPS